MSNYTPEQLTRFRNKDKRISFLSIFSSLCMFYAGKDVPIEDIRNEAKNEVEKLINNYPLEGTEPPAYVKAEGKDVPF